jgi:hypothetical protein
VRAHNLLDTPTPNTKRFGAETYKLPPHRLERRGLPVMNFLRGTLALQAGRRSVDVRFQLPEFL